LSPLRGFFEAEDSQYPVVAAFVHDGRSRLVPTSPAPWQPVDGGFPEDKVQDTFWYAVDCVRADVVRVRAAFLLRGGSKGFHFEATQERGHWRLVRVDHTWVE
jgi:hypothetical protein